MWPVVTQMLTVLISVVLLVFIELYCWCLLGCGCSGAGVLPGAMWGAEPPRPVGRLLSGVPIAASFNAGLDMATVEKSMIEFGEDCLKNGTRYRSAAGKAAITSMQHICFAFYFQVFLSKFFISSCLREH